MAKFNIEKSLLNELLLVLFYAVLAALLGLLFNRAILLFLIVMVSYLGWTLYNVSQLLSWLYKPSKNVPESRGVWDEIFRQTYQQYQRQRKARRRLTSMLTRFQESTRALPYSTVVLNKYDEIEWFNPAARKMFGLSAKKDIGRNIINLVRHPSFAGYLRNGKFKKPLELSYNNRDMVITITAYGSGQNLMITRDVTQRKELDIMRRDFIANASHELRTPITVIVGFLEILHDKAPEDLLMPIESIQRQTDRMQRMLLELLELAKLESEAYVDTPEMVDLNSLLKDLYKDALSIDNQAHNISLDAEKISVEGSSEELAIAISNLITNAIRYTPEGGDIKIYTQHNEIETCVVVEDTGIGIEDEHIPRLTERFYRVDPGRSREQGGTGLGLAIVKHVLERHDGHLFISSVPGEGSIFRCCFPTV